MSVLGIDPGTTVGWAYVDGRDGVASRWGTEVFRLKKDQPEGARWVKFREWFIDLPRPTLVVFEDQNEFGRGVMQSGKVGILMASRIVEFCHQFGVPCKAVNPMTVKAFAIPALPRPKKGQPKNPPLDRSKTAMIAAARLRLIGENPCLTYDLQEHEADALWMAWWGMERHLAKEAK